MSQQQYTPHLLNIDQVHLFDDIPSDDYQRLYFNHYLLEQHNNPANTSHQLNLSIRQNDYKSNIVNIFNNPPYLSNKDNKPSKNHDITGNSNKNLSCFEYQLPDVDVGDNDAETHENLIDKTPYVLRGSIKTDSHGHTDLESKENLDNKKKSKNRPTNDNEKLVITKRSVNTDNTNIKLSPFPVANITTTGTTSTGTTGTGTAATGSSGGDTIKSPYDNKFIYDLNTKTGDISLSSNQNLSSLKTSLNQHYSFHDTDTNTTDTNTNTTTPTINPLKHNTSDDVNQNINTLTKNQQFKLTKMNYNSVSNSNLINPNNCILWDKNTGYVFVTGIWRLYQDIMNGLSSIDRLSTNFKNDHIYMHSDDLKEKCRLELDYILNYAFYEPISWDGKQTRRRKNSLGSGSGIDTQQQKRDVQNDNSTNTANKGEDVKNKIIEYTHYVDLHWNNLSKDLKHLILDDFQKMLDEKYPGNHVNNLDMSLHIIQRIRGGYIKIQGTWLPWTVARLMCTRFCFPIRWLLVPLFGPRFPKECEDYYFNIMLKNMKYIEQQNSLNLSKKDNVNHKKSSTRTRRNTYSGVSSVTKNTASSITNTRSARTKQRKKRHSATNIPPLIGPTEEEISPRTKKVDLKISNDNLTGFPPQFIPKVSRKRRSKSDFGINPHMNFNPLLSSTILSSSSPTSASSTSTTTGMPSSLPPIKSVFEQINPYDAPFLAAPNTLFNLTNLNTVDNTNQPFITRPRLNSLPCPSITNPNKYYTNNYTYGGSSNPHSGVSALSNLAMFYNTRGHRYSYPKDFMQPRVISGDDENTDAGAVTTTTNSNNNTIGITDSSNFVSYGVSTSESFHANNNGVNYNSNYKWFAGSRKN